MAVVYIVVKGERAPLQNPTYSSVSDEIASNVVISTRVEKSLNHIAADIEPMRGMTNPSTGAVMIDSLFDSTGHAYGM